MQLYRKIIPKIARDTARTLATLKLIEIEDGKQDEAELDMAAVMVEYLNEEDRINKEARDLLAKRGISADRFSQAKKSVADMRGFKIGDEGLEYILDQLSEALFASSNIAEVYADDVELRKNIRDTINKYLSISESLDKAARGRLRNLREGSPEWEIEYPRIIAQLKKQKGLT
ncbi:MAG: DUF507 family protein [bacterium]|nr:DUF507 family protein [bacterium]